MTDKVSYQKNKEYYKEYNKKKYQKNKEKYKEYYQNNKDKINARGKEYRKLTVNCECGGHYTRDHKARHCKSIKHIEYLSSDNV
jgi:hypothetical protein